MKKDPRRTFDPEEATTFFIPYDIASDMAFYTACAKNTNLTCYDFRKCPLGDTVGNLLLDSKYYHRNQGRDHVLIIGLNYGMVCVFFNVFPYIYLYIYICIYNL